MVLEHRNGVGMFPKLQQIELALSQLKATDFPIQNVSIVVEHLASGDPTLEKLPEPMVQSEDQVDCDRTLRRIEIGALASGALGSVVGGLVAGLTTLAFPAGSGAVLLELLFFKVGAPAQRGLQPSFATSLLVGMVTGAFYGAVSGGLLGGAIGVSISDKQVRHYQDLLTQGYIPSGNQRN